MSNNINGGGRGRNMASSMDFYRRVPKDLTEVRLRHYYTPRIGGGCASVCRKFTYIATRLLRVEVFGNSSKNTLKNKKQN